MAELVVMPKLSDTMEEGVIATWLKKEGDTIEEGDVLAEIETDKATMEYESPADGTILKIVADTGKKLSLGEPICVIGEKGEEINLDQLLKDGKSQKTDTEPEQPNAERPKERESQLTAKPSKTETLSTSVTPSGRVRSSPLARKLAHEKGIDLSQVKGTGPHGRVIQRDVESFSGAAAQAPSGRLPTSMQDQVVAASMMRQTIAKRLHIAKNEAPHYYLTVSCDMTAVNSWRKHLNDEVDANKPEQSPPKVSVNDIIMMAAARALRKHPYVNASWEGEQIRLFGSVHMAMAVALPTGLITPVIRNCDQLGARDIARESRGLASRAKNNELQPEDYSGGTFTVSNLGMFGIEQFTAIINPPQSAILAVGATTPTPWISDQGDIVIQPRMKMTMSCDHRVVDGATGAAFLQTLVRYLEEPLMMLAD